MGSVLKKVCHIALLLALIVMPATGTCVLAEPLSKQAATGADGFCGLYSFKNAQYAMLSAASFQPGFAAQEASFGMSHLSEALGLAEAEDWPPRHSRQWWNSRSPVAPSQGLDGRLEIMTVLFRSYQLEKPGLADLREWDGILAELTPFDRHGRQDNDNTFRAGRLSAKLLAARDVDSAHGFLNGLSSASSLSDPTRQDDSDSNNQSSGYMALQMGKGPLGITIGGGYSRTELATTGGEASAAPKGGMSLSSLSSPGSQSSGSGSPYASVGRWSAFLAVPYQITESLGLAPEFTYYHGDSPEYSEDAGNEWIMGLQIRFGF